MIKDHLCIVFAIEHYNPLGVIRTLGEHGIAPVYIAIKGKAKVASTSKYISKCYYVDSAEEGYEILMKEYSNFTGNLPFIFASDDKTMGCLDKHYDELKNKFIFFNAGATGRITEFINKSNILELAKKHGLKILRTWIVKRGEIPNDLEYPIITKSISPNVGGWKSDVHICHSKQELQEAFKDIESPTVLLQKYILKKNEYCLEGFSVAHGKQTFISIASTYKYLLPNYYSPYHDVTNFNDTFLQKALGGMLEEIGFEGIFEIEFLIDQDGSLYFSEINFRNSTWSYSSTLAGMPLPILWAQAMLDGKIKDNIYKKVPEGFTAMVEPIDYAKRVLSGNIGLFEWLADLRKCNCTYYYNSDDMNPYYEMAKNAEKLY